MRRLTTTLAILFALALSFSWADVSLRAPGSSGYDTIDDEDTPLTQRSTLNFAGAGVTCADDTTQTTCTISGSGSPLTTKGDLFTFDTSDSRLPVGTDGHVLTADSAEATGIKWAAASGGQDTYMLLGGTTNSPSNSAVRFFPVNGLADAASSQNPVRYVGLGEGTVIEYSCRLWPAPSTGSWLLELVDGGGTTRQTCTIANTETNCTDMTSGDYVLPTGSSYLFNRITPSGGPDTPTNVTCHLRIAAP